MGCLSWLQLEVNICSIALSTDWFKLMDDWLIELSMFPSAPITVVVAQKRGPGRRRQRNQAEVTAEGSEDDSFTWSRGGKLSKVILSKAVLSQPAIRKAACQGILVCLCLLCLLQFLPIFIIHKHMESFFFLKHIWRVYLIFRLPY